MKNNNYVEEKIIIVLIINTNKDETQVVIYVQVIYTIKC